MTGPYSSQEIQDEKDPFSKWLMGKANVEYALDVGPVDLEEDEEYRGEY